MITNVHTIRLMGGEPLLHPEVVKFCKATRELFPNSEIVLVSNGLLLPKLSNLDIEDINDNNIALCMSNYGLNLNLKTQHESDGLCLCVMAFILNGLHKCCCSSWKQVFMHINETQVLTSCCFLSKEENLYIKLKCFYKYLL